MAQIGKDKVKESALAQIKDKSAEIARFLPKFIEADRFVRILMSAVQTTPKIGECTEVSILTSIMQAAQLGLEPNNFTGTAYLIPYKGRCTLQPGYKGLIELARRSGQLSTIFAYCVHAGDKFDFQLGLNPDLKHTPAGDNYDDKGNPKEVTHVYACAHLKDGGTQFEVMTRREIESVRLKKSKSPHGPAWKDNWDAMAKKTVIIRLLKMVPASINREERLLQSAVALDEHISIGLPVPENLGDLNTTTNLDTGEITDRPANAKLKAMADNIDVEPAPSPSEQAADPETPFPSKEEIEANQQNAGAGTGKRDLFN